MTAASWLLIAFVVVAGVMLALGQAWGVSRRPDAVAAQIEAECRAAAEHGWDVGFRTGWAKRQRIANLRPVNERTVR